MPTIKLITIKCNVPDEIDMDEMYLKFDGEKIWPYDKKFFRIDVNDQVAINHQMEVPAGWVEIELWDYDYISLNDHLGTFKFKVDNEAGVFSTSMIQNRKETKSASYFMEWEIV